MEKSQARWTLTGCRFSAIARGLRIASWLRAPRTWEIESHISGCPPSSAGSDLNSGREVDANGFDFSLFIVAGSFTEQSIGRVVSDEEDTLSFVG